MKPIQFDKELNQFDHIIDLKFGRSFQIHNAQLFYFGIEHIWGKQAKFGISGSDQTSILRLEVFANRQQLYQQVLDVTIGDIVDIGVAKVKFLNKKESELYMAIDAKNKSHIKKSFFNNTHKQELSNNGQYS